MKIYIESLGCVRNSVDSEVMAGHLEKADHAIVDDPSLADVIVVNTCGFISAASEEAVDVILAMAQLKKTGKLKRLIVTGCLAERYKNDNLDSIMPEVDAFLGTGAVNRIVNAVEDRSLEILALFPDPGGKKQIQGFPLPRKFKSITPAYIKISEGCKRKCTYCIIPKLRGTQRSRPVDEILTEVEEFIVKGSKEIALVAENTTDYGLDLKESANLENVLDKVAEKVKQLSEASILSSPWVRLLYTYPSTLSKEIIDTIIKSPDICSYFDVPVQHASSKILKRMGRGYLKDDLYELFRLIRIQDPNAALRTTIITGFPGESEEDFNDLLRFVEDIKFDHLGVFTYSDSDDLKSHAFDNHVPQDIADKRHDIIMEKQAQISYNINLKHIGKIFKVLVEEKFDKGVYLGRTWFQAPEVDGLTFIYGFDLEIGAFVDVKITESYEYDIAGEVV
ncbi:MAG: 30S ribosomal protein S12 methylthiotransferase RimO [Desulfobacteraceae bacterium]|nr:30S ribosomal protein S12 methylthiotransferase RimO [Desulfobacteraceae bacterium]